ncbi:MAG: hypothetical protein A2Y15_04740 [Clostridiales bacterium GWF2_36_10]|nr:MAG: hypothetical protein A2Y15_04740 [Clostridiales bacterium GWF2_36_10]HAN20859.1 hypothetical protein [Clostridiales bacterium]
MSNLLKYENINVESSQILFNNLNPDSNKSTRILSDPIRAKEEAKKIIDEANKYSIKIKDNAQLNAERVYEEAKAAGYEAGIEIAMDEIERKNQNTLNEIKQILKKLDEQKSKLIEDNKQNAIDLAFKVAEKIISQKVEANDSIILQFFQKAVKDLVAQKWLKVSIAEYDVEVITSNSKYLLNMVGGAERLEIEVLENAPRGTCIVETTEKIADASVNTQLETLYKSVVNT